MHIYFEYKDSQECWDHLNEYFFNRGTGVVDDGGFRKGPQLLLYNVICRIRRAWVNPEFDFGNTFGYRSAKWNGLVGNYLDLNYVDLIKSEVVTREKKKQTAYNVSMQFTNSHGHGKNCLLSLTFTRRDTDPYPILCFTLRSSEITKRLLLDLLLVQRVGEYVYGKDKHFAIEMFVINMYQHAESFTMYDSYKKLENIDLGNEDPWKKDIYKLRTKFLETPPLEISYKMHQRCARQLQRDENGVPWSGDKPMLTKELIIFDDTIEYPEDCYTIKDRRKYKAKLKRQGKV